MQTQSFEKTSLTKTEILSEIATIISAEGNDGWPDKIHAILKLLGAENFPIEVLRTLKIRGEFFPRSKEYPFTPKVKYLTFLWECFDTLPLSNDESFAIPFKRLLASYLFKSCGKNLIAKKGVYLNFPHLLSVGNNVYLDENVNLDSKGTITIGDNVYIGKETFIITHVHGEVNHEERSYFPVGIENNVKLHSRIIVLGRENGTKILNGTIVLEDSLVSKTIGGIVSGIPAYPVKNPNDIKPLELSMPKETDLIAIPVVEPRQEQQKCSSSSSSEDGVKKLLGSIVSIIGTPNDDWSSDIWAQKISHILQLLGASQYSLTELKSIVLPEESYPECKQYPFTNKIRYLTWLWRTFEKLPLHTALTFAVAFRRILVEQLFKKCGRNITIAHGVYFDFPQRIEVGSNCVITEYTRIEGRGGFVMGDNVGLGERVHIETCPLHQQADPSKPSIILCDHARIAAAVTIRDKKGKGIVIGKGAAAGAKAVVIENVLEYTLVVGDPAKKLKDLHRSAGGDHSSKWYNNMTTSSNASCSSTSTVSPSCFFSSPVVAQQLVRKLLKRTQLPNNFKTTVSNDGVKS